MTVHVKPLWTIEDVSTYLGVPVKTLYGWRLKKVGPAAVRIGKHLRYDPDEVVDWVKSRRVAS
jgi:predicted DNA-binding transcriptional regulator AlpA